MSSFTPLPALAGGALIALASAALLLGLGRIAGITGILADAAVGPRGDRLWRVCFLVGLGAGGLIAFRIAPERFDLAAPVSLPLVALAGVLVGVGTRLA